MRTRTSILIGLGCIIAVGAGVALSTIGPRNLIGMLRYDQRQTGRLKPGDQAPDVPLLTLDGEERRLSQHIGQRPLVLIFGSFT